MSNTLYQLHVIKEVIGSFPRKFIVNSANIPHMQGLICDVIITDICSWTHKPPNALWSI
jgi:hypothetical protein